MAQEFHRVQGNPRIDVLEGGEYAVDDTWEAFDYATLSLALADILPAQGSTFTIAPYNTATLRTHTVERRQDTDVWVVNLHYETVLYKTEKNSGSQPEEDISGWTYNFNDNGIIKPIESLNKGTGDTAKKYLKKWNYDLVSFEEDDNEPSWWDTYGSDPTKPEVMTAEVSRQYKWVRDDVEVPVEKSGIKWKYLKRRTKPGVDDYITSAPTVIAQRAYLSDDYAEWLSTASFYADMVGRIGAPTEKFGLESGSWLITSVATNNSAGSKYIYVTVNYTWAEAWDTEIYE
jgi:hypothetical protein